MFRCDIKNADDGSVVVELAGVLDEMAKLDAALVPDEKVIVFNFSQLSGINSNGIRLWIGFIQDIAERDSKLHFQQCRVPFIDQATVLPNLIPSGVVVESFFTPYFCAECEEEAEVLVEVAKVESDGFQSERCKQCERDMDADEFGQEYLDFVLRLRE